jgi:hypothetical protein
MQLDSELIGGAVKGLRVPFPPKRHDWTVINILFLVKVHARS